MSQNLVVDHFLQMLKKVVRILLYGPAVSQSGCRKAGPYQLPSNNKKYCYVEVSVRDPISSFSSQVITQLYKIIFEKSVFVRIFEKFKYFAKQTIFSESPDHVL